VEMMKRQWVVALVLVLLIPLVTVLGGMLFSLINPEIAAGHPNYQRNWHLLHLLKLTMMWGSMAVVGVLWVLGCLLVIRAREQSRLWLFLAALGPFGFAILAMLNDRAPAEADWYSRFVSKLNWFLRIGYELCTFVIVWALAEEAMVLKRNLMIRYQAATTGMSVSQIIDIRNASSGMWAFGEGMEVMFLVVLLYLLRPVVFNIVARLAPITASPKPS
jgi:hypothetical protein